IQVVNSSFDLDALKGIYVEKLDNALFDTITVNSSGTSGASSAGIDMNLKHGTYTNITVQHAQVLNSGTGAASSHSVTSKGRTDGGNGPTSVSTVHLTYVTIDGGAVSPIELSIEDKVTGVTMSSVQLLGSGGGLYYGVGVPDAPSVGDTQFAGTLSYYIGIA